MGTYPKYSEVPPAQREDTETTMRKTLMNTGDYSELEVLLMDHFTLMTVYRDIVLENRIRSTIKKLKF